MEIVPRRMPGGKGGIAVPVRHLLQPQRIGGTQPAGRLSIEGRNHLAADAGDLGIGLQDQWQEAAQEQRLAAVAVRHLVHVPGQTGHSQARHRRAVLEARQGVAVGVKVLG